MILKNIKDRQKGFTIVELLVVIVVIGILAAITIVSYTGITQRANTTKALSNAQSVQNVIEVYAAENSGVYPSTIASITEYNGTTKIPAGITVVANDDPSPLSTATGDAKFNITYECLTSCTSSTGGRITYWDFTYSDVSETYVYVGAATSADTSWDFPV